MRDAVEVSEVGLHCAQAAVERALHALKEDRTGVAASSQARIVAHVASAETLAHCAGGLVDVAEDTRRRNMAGEGDMTTRQEANANHRLVSAKSELERLRLVVKGEAPRGMRAVGGSVFGAAARRVAGSTAVRDALRAANHAVRVRVAWCCSVACRPGVSRMTRVLHDCRASWTPPTAPT